MPELNDSTTHPRYHLLKSLDYSQREAVASSTMTSTCDNFMNAYALHLGATSIQMGFLTAFPQLIGSLMQVVSVWLGTFLTRRLLVLLTAVVQAVLMFAFAVLAMMSGDTLAGDLIYLVIAYQCSSNLIQPQWRAWLGSMVQHNERGKFFAARTRLTMATSLVMFLVGGVVLTLTDSIGLAGIGFFLLFLVATLGRAYSSFFLFNMQDPAPQQVVPVSTQFYATFGIVREAFKDSVFSNYSYFVAGVQGAAAVSAPFFAVYMLKVLHYNYFEYSINLVAAIATQFLFLRYWGKLSDKHGNRFIMLLCSALLPIVPVLWLFSANFYYLLVVQLISGLAWSGFNLTTANYLYDIRPHQTNFATYAALQAVVTAVMVFAGGLAGGYLAALSAVLMSLTPFSLGEGLFIVFVVSGLLRGAMLLWFIPRAEEPRIRTHPQLFKLLYRIARYNSNGVVLDWLTVGEKDED
jgi:MFS family permease